MADLNSYRSAERPTHGTDALASAPAGHPQAAAPHEAAGGHESESKHAPEVPSGLDLLASLKSAQTGYNVQIGARKTTVSPAGIIHTYQNQFYSLLIVAVVAIVLSRKLRAMSLRAPGRFQVAVEMIVDAFRNLVYGVLGEKDGRRYLPYIGSLFIFIFLNNIMGIIPLMRSPSSMYQTTFGLAICTFLYVQYTAVSRNGIVRYVYHLMGEPGPTGSTGLTIFMWAMSIFLLFPLHVLSEFIRPVSLSLRLFGNILGEDILLGVFVTLGISIVSAIGVHAPLPGLPLQLPFFFLACLTSIVQATVFSLLSLIYFLMALPHQEHGEHEGVAEAAVQH